MPWFKVDDALHAHPKAAEAGLEAMGLWLMCGAHCAAFPRLAGFVSRSCALRFTRRSSILDRLASKLVSSGLWMVEGDGWRFHDWLDYQPSPEASDKARLQRIAAGRAGGQEKARKASRVAGEPSSEPPDNRQPFASDVRLARSRSRSRPDPIPDPGPRAREESPRPEPIVLPSAYGGAYARGIEAGTGRPVTMPSGEALARLAAIVDVHARADGATTTEPQLRWIETAATDFARAADGFLRGRGLVVRDFENWLNGRHVPRPGVQPAAKGAPSWTSRNPNAITAEELAAKAAKEAGNG